MGLKGPSKVLCYVLEPLCEQFFARSAGSGLARSFLGHLEARWEKQGGADDPFRSRLHVRIDLSKPTLFESNRCSNVTSE